MKSKKETKASARAKKGAARVQTKKAPGRTPATKSVVKKAVAKKAVAKKAVAKKARNAGRTPPARKAALAKKAKKAPPKVVATPPAAKKAAKKKATPAPAAARPIRRRDALGHLDPKYAADLRRQSGKEEEDNGAFLGNKARSSDSLAENLGEQFVQAATSGEDDGEEALDQIVPEERGGPFVETTAGTEFAEGTDASNPKSAKREPFPTT